MERGSLNQGCSITRPLEHWPPGLRDLERKLTRHKNREKMDFEREAVTPILTQLLFHSKVFMPQLPIRFYWIDVFTVCCTVLIIILCLYL